MIHKKWHKHCQNRQKINVFIPWMFSTAHLQHIKADKRQCSYHKPSHRYVSTSERVYANDRNDAARCEPKEGILIFEESCPCSDILLLNQHMITVSIFSSVSLISSASSPDSSSLSSSWLSSLFYFASSSISFFFFAGTSSSSKLYTTSSSFSISTNSGF